MERSCYKGLQTYPATDVPEQYLHLGCLSYSTIPGRGLWGNGTTDKFLGLFTVKFDSSLSNMTFFEGWGFRGINLTITSVKA